LPNAIKIRLTVAPPLHPDCLRAFGDSDCALNRLIYGIYKSGR
jgi:hypothetical protein